MRRDPIGEGSGSPVFQVDGTYPLGSGQGVFDHDSGFPVGNSALVYVVEGTCVSNEAEKKRLLSSNLIQSIP